MSRDCPGARGACLYDPSPCALLGCERAIREEAARGEPKPIAKRATCPVCPDGYVWNESGPTDRACPTCGGTAFVYVPA